MIVEFLPGVMAIFLNVEQVNVECRRIARRSGVFLKKNFHPNPHLMGPR